MFTNIWRDLVHAGRSLAKARAFTLVCVVSLGIGMAPVIAVPYAVHVVDLTMTPPGIATDGLVEVLTKSNGPHEASNDWSFADFTDLRAVETGLAITGWTNGNTDYAVDTAGGTDTSSVPTIFVASDYFRIVGVGLARGQGFGASDVLGPDEPVVVVGYDFWQNRLAADPNVVGSRITLDGVSHLVVGVAAEGFDGHLAFDGRQLFLPLGRHPLLRARNEETDAVRANRQNAWIHLHARLSPGVTVAQADAAVSAVTARLAAAYPATNEFISGTVAPYDPIGVSARFQFRLFQAVAMTLTGMVLLVVCLNISGMMLVRYAGRERELSVRQAIGASRWHLVRNLLSESVILAGIGGTLAALLLFNAPRLLLWLSDGNIPPRFVEAMAFDLHMFLTCVVFCLVTSVLCGWLPARRFSRPVIISSLKDDAGVGGLRAGRVHRFTAALQVAIAVPLIVMAGISLDRIRSTATSDLGFNIDAIHAAPMALDEPGDDSAGFRIRSALEQLAATSGIQATTVADGLPLDFRYRNSRVALQTGSDEAPAFVSVHMTRAGGNYFETMGMHLSRGRGFSENDRAGGERVAVISATLAAALLPGVDASDALGRRLTFGTGEDGDHALTIVGVAADVPTSQMSTERAQLWVPLAQQPSPQVFLIARSAPDAPAAQIHAALENAIRAVDPDGGRGLATTDGVAFSRIVTGVSLRENSMRDFLVQSMVAGGSGGVILTLSALGIYGVIGLMVAMRTREIAVRVALGASRRQVMRLILFDVVKLVIPGVAIGLLLTVALMRVNSENMGIALSDVEYLAYVLGAAVAVAVAVLASLAPARRAASVQPIVAMRAQ